MNQNKRGRFRTLAEFIAALLNEEIDRSRVQIVEYTSSGSVVATLRPAEVDGDEVGDGEELYRSDSLETFLLDVGKALGVEAYIA